ncbi:GTP-binding protein [Euzebyella saccharophila]|uniref:GTP-binding protein n=1 Tax=Euzebyella saccharophila TaxID=679664 RepID=A0ABV8JWN7_9FLAO|nr:GTP-binding protein [Euzebyella saccharophila]
MKALPNDIVLRPRFQLELAQTKETLLSAFEKSEEKPFIIKRLDDHVFIKFNTKHIHFWSPQLHLEINDTEDGNSKLYGLFGPNPTLWTFFMFLHFGVATVFIILGIWAYSSASLNRPYVLQLSLMVLMVIIWLALYAFGRVGKHKGKPQMHELYIFMQRVLNDSMNLS